MKAGFIQEIRFITWLVNVVMVKKSTGKWRMPVDFTDVNKDTQKTPILCPALTSSSIAPAATST